MEWSYKAKAIRIIHMSDIHLVKDGAKIWDTDTKSHFNKASVRLKILMLSLYQEICLTMVPCGHINTLMSHSNR